jgi:hypothetical protein
MSAGSLSSVSVECDFFYASTLQLEVTHQLTPPCKKTHATATHTNSHVVCKTYNYTGRLHMNERYSKSSKASHVMGTKIDQSYFDQCHYNFSPSHICPYNSLVGDLSAN